MKTGIVIAIILTFYVSSNKWRLETRMERLMCDRDRDIDDG